MVRIKQSINYNSWGKKKRSWNILEKLKHNFMAQYVDHFPPILAKPHVRPAVSCCSEYPRHSLHNPPWCFQERVQPYVFLQAVHLQREERIEWRVEFLKEKGKLAVVTQWKSKVGRWWLWVGSSNDKVYPIMLFDYVLASIRILPGSITGFFQTWYASWKITQG